MARRRNRFGRKRGSQISFRSREKKFHIGILYEILQWVFLCFAAVFLAFAIVYAFGVKTSVIGESMEPGLSNGQEVLINKVAYQFTAPKQGDVVVFRPNGNENAHFSIKRVIAVPGDTVLISNGKVMINGMVYSDDVADDTRDGGIAKELINLGPDEYFVLGDNRNSSEDSRSANIGNISREMIEGKAWYHLKGKNSEKGRVK